MFHSSFVTIRCFEEVQKCMMILLVSLCLLALLPLWGRGKKCTFHLRYSRTEYVQEYGTYFREEVVLTHHQFYLEL